MTNTIETQGQRPKKELEKGLTPQAMGVTEEWSYLTEDMVESSAPIVDFDSDGALEILVGSKDKQLHCVNHT